MPNPKAPAQPPYESFSNPWCVYATLAQATHAIEDIIDKSMGFPKEGKHAHDNTPAPEAQKTLTWAEPRERAEGGWAFPAPPEAHLPSDCTMEEYDPAWFPMPPPP